MMNSSKKKLQHTENSEEEYCTKKNSDVIVITINLNLLIINILVIHFSIKKSLVIFPLYVLQVIIHETTAAT